MRIVVWISIRLAIGNRIVLNKEDWINNTPTLAGLNTITKVNTYLKQEDKNTSPSKINLKAIINTESDEFQKEANNWAGMSYIYNLGGVSISPIHGILNSELTSDFQIPDNTEDFLILPQTKPRNLSFRELEKTKKQILTKKRWSTINCSALLGESPCFGNKELRSNRKWEARMSKLTHEEIRSIRTMNYSPSQNTDKSPGPSHSPSSKNKKIQNTMVKFKLLHAEEASNMSKGFSQVQSSKNLNNDLKIKLIAAEGSSQLSKRNSNSIYAFSRRHSHIPVEAINSQGGAPLSKDQLFVEMVNKSKYLCLIVSPFESKRV